MSQKYPGMNALDDILPDDSIDRDEALVTSLGWVCQQMVRLREQFSDSNSKGISIAGATGEAIFAVSDGKVVYSGNGLRGYGNLIIIKHPDEFITAYAHNKSIFVRRVRPLIEAKRSLKWECLKRIPLNFCLR